MAFAKRQRRVTHRPPNAASVRAVVAALEALHAPPRGLSAEQLLAEREELARDSTRRRQGELCLAPPPRGALCR